MSTTTAQPRTSVVIGFKDWGLERLELSLQTIQESLAQTPHEIVIVDYGSSDTDAIAEVASRAGAHHERVRTHGEWSRSRALNAGVRASRGDIILATDADMLFSPGALDRVTEKLENRPQEIVILQCRDLPTGYSHDVVSREGVDWGRFATIGHLRPRWGMGGLVGVRRELWERLRGWDERMHTYGGEDIDFAQRAQRIGARIDWLDEPGVAMYHVWHPSSSASASRSPAAAAAVAANRRIRDKDLTFARNRTAARYLPQDLPPLVSIIVEAAEDSEELERTLVTVLGQSIRDIEVIVDDNLSVDAWGPQVRLASSSSGPRGTFTAVARAGEIWAADHLESLLAAWVPGAGLLTARTADLVVDDDGKPLGEMAAAVEDSPSLRSTMVRTSILPSEADLSSRGWPAAVRAAAATGAEWITLPEIRHLTVTTVDSIEHLHDERADDATLLSTVLHRCGLSLPELPAPRIVDLGVLADVAINRGEIRLRADLAGATDLPSARSLVRETLAWRVTSIRTTGGDVLRSECVWQGDDLPYAARVRRELEDLGASVSVLSASSSPRSALVDVDPVSLVRSQEAGDSETQGPGLWIAASVEPDGFDITHRTLDAASPVELLMDRVVESQGEETTWVLARLRDASLPEAWATAAEVTSALTVSVIELRESDDQKENA